MCPYTTIFNQHILVHVFLTFVLGIEVLSVQLMNNILLKEKNYKIIKIRINQNVGMKFFLEIESFVYCRLAMVEVSIHEDNT